MAALAETGERLSAWLTVRPPAGKPEDGVLLTMEENSMTAYPAGRLLYYPATSNEREAPLEVFAEGELLEFLQAQPAKAADVYRVLAESKNTPVRAGALLRLARVLEKDGAARGKPGSLHAAGGLRRSARGGSSRRTGGAPRLGDLSVRADLLRGRWHLTRGQFEFYFGGGAPEDRLALAEAAEQAWNAHGRTRAEHGVGGRASFPGDVADQRSTPRRTGGDSDAPLRRRGGLRRGG